METKLAVCLRLRREKFNHEIYLPSDDIFALLVSGSFKITGISPKEYRNLADKGYKISLRRVDNFCAVS